ncbi:MAG: T9SS type A sorting domain-containing protein [Bacteroidales bacterium]|nr:T9SS type A sorting domain-containing protein [Bacteroidales bacterium]
MKKSLFISAFLLVTLVGELWATPAHGHYRWRDDNGTEVTASWLANEDDSLIQTNEGNIRLRMELYHWDVAEEFSEICYLYYASGEDTIWHRVGDEPSNLFEYYDSPNVTNNQATVSSRLSKSDPSCANVAGVIRESADAFLITLTEDTRKEFEFCIKPVSGIDYNQVYFFRVEDEDPDAATFYYALSICPRLFLEKPVLTVTADDAERHQGEENPEFTLTYSGFVDGDDESIIDEAPSLICDANASSVPGTYDIVAYGGEDNKYEFNYVEGTLTVTEPNAFKHQNVETIKVYPNPVKDFVYIEGIVSKDYSVRIVDISGRIILERKIENNTIDLSSLQRGIYLLKIANRVHKIIKE